MALPTSASVRAEDRLAGAQDPLGNSVSLVGFRSMRCGKTLPGVDVLAVRLLLIRTPLDERAFAARC